MTKEQILNYLRITPTNTNPAVVEGMLDQMSGSDDISQYVALFKTYAEQKEDGSGVDFSPVDVEEIQDALSNNKMMGLLVDPKNVNPNGEPAVYSFSENKSGYLLFSSNDLFGVELQINIETGAVSIKDPVA